MKKTSNKLSVSSTSKKETVLVLYTVTDLLILNVLSACPHNCNNNKNERSHVRVAANFAGTAAARRRALF